MRKPLSLDISESELKGLVTMDGYCVHKNIGTFTNCKGCTDLMLNDKTLEFEISSPHFDYLKGLDRGSLKWPSEDWLNCVVEAAKVFKTLVKSEETEKKFISVLCPRYTLHQLIVKRILDLELCRVCIVCGTFSHTLVEKCAHNLVNIFLNNYRKVLTNNAFENKKNRTNNVSSDKVKSKAQRKLKTVNKL